MQALSEARPGEIYTIKWMFGVPEVLEFLHSHHYRFLLLLLLSSYLS